MIGISSDKDAKPFNAVGMTKAIMERILIEGNMWSETRFNCVRYGNVIASLGSVVPLFLDQIAYGQPITVTSREMTRFLLRLDGAVNVVFSALQNVGRGEIFVPDVPAARIIDLTEAMIDGRDIPIIVTGIRPGEKVHEIMISDEESNYTTARAGYYVIRPMLPELLSEPLGEPALTSEYSASKITLDRQGIKNLIQEFMTGSREGEIA